MALTKVYDAMLAIPVTTEVKQDIVKRAKLEGIPFTLYVRRMLFQALYGANVAPDDNSVKTEN